MHEVPAEPKWFRKVLYREMTVRTWGSTVTYLDKQIYYFSELIERLTNCLRCSFLFVTFFFFMILRLKMFLPAFIITRLRRCWTSLLLHNYALHGWLYWFDLDLIFSSAGSRGSLSVYSWSWGCWVSIWSHPIMSFCSLCFSKNSN